MSFAGNQVTVVAVPDAQTLVAQRAAEARAEPIPPRPTVEDLRARAAAALVEVWPPSGGALLGWELALPARDSARLTVRHAGPAIGAAGEQLLSRAMNTALGAPLAVRAVSLPAVPLVASAGRERAWLDSAAAILAEVAHTDSAVACIRGPLRLTRRRTGVHRTILRALRVAPALDSARVTIADGARWEISVAARSCAGPSVATGASAP